MDEVKTLEMEAEIAKILNMKPEYLKYEHIKKQPDKPYTINLSTESPNGHKTKFLFHSASGNTYDEAMIALYEYVTKHMKNQDTYEIRWHNPVEKLIECSWFRASDIMEALHKFYHDKEIGEYKVYEVTLKPYA